MCPLLHSVSHTFVHLLVHLCVSSFVRLLLHTSCVSSLVCVFKVQSFVGKLRAVTGDALCMSESVGSFQQYKVVVYILTLQNTCMCRVQLNQCHLNAYGSGLRAICNACRSQMKDYWDVASRAFPSVNQHPEARSAGLLRSLRLSQDIKGFFKPLTATAKAANDANAVLNPIVGCQVTLEGVGVQWASVQVCAALHSSSLCPLMCLPIVFPVSACPLICVALSCMSALYLSAK